MTRGDMLSSAKNAHCCICWVLLLAMLLLLLLMLLAGWLACWLLR